MYKGAWEASKGFTKSSKISKKEEPGIILLDSWSYVKKFDVMSKQNLQTAPALAAWAPSLPASAVREDGMQVSRMLVSLLETHLYCLTISLAVKPDCITLTGSSA
nr:hypothetical protein [uncultured Acetatifactor sp.]